MPPKVKIPNVKRPQPPTLEAVYSDFRKALTFQVNKVVLSFMEQHSDEALEAFLPDDIDAADAWISERLDRFLDNEDPTTEDMLDGMAALFMMAFLERIYEATGVLDETDEDDSDDSDEDDEDDSDESDFRKYQDA
jgi:hypothetical protein